MNLDRPDAYTAAFLLGFIRDDERALDLDLMAERLNCPADVASVKEALRVIAEVGEERGEEWAC